MWRSIPFLSLFLPVLLAGAAAAQAPPQVAPFEAATVNQFLVSCDRDISQCDFKIRLALLDALHTPDATSVCLKGAHYQEPVIAWLKAHPETGTMATEDGIYAAFKGLYPCP
jgi:hypothetical protein